MFRYQTLNQASKDYSRIERILSFIETSPAGNISLEEISQKANLSQFHFQKVFKRWVGLSPKQFLSLLSLGHAKELLHSSHSLLDTSLELQLSGPSRLHDLFLKFEAMTPGEFKKGGAGLSIVYGFHPTPFGECLIAMTDKGICALRFLTDKTNFSALSELKQEWPKARFNEKKEKTRKVINRIFCNQEGHEEGLSLFVKGTPFQLKVWQALMAVPEGAVISYVGLAEFIGAKNGTRAVARAIASNPIAYLIPCHRVIRKMGGMGGYRWGIPRKQALLAWEQSDR